MTSFALARQTIADACRRALPGTPVHATMPASVSPPVAVVRPAQPAIMYRGAYGARLAHWKFELLVILGKVDERVAQERLGELLSPDSDLVQELLNAELGNGYLTVVDARLADFGPYASARWTVAATA